MSTLTEGDVFDALPYAFVLIGVLFIIGARTIGRMSQLNDDPHRHKAIEGFWIGAGFPKGRAWRWLYTYMAVLIGLLWMGIGIG